jgi:hypothetical protein
VLGHESRRFGFESAPYSPDWSARLVVSCEIDRNAPASVGEPKPSDHQDAGSLEVLR